MKIGIDAGNARVKVAGPTGIISLDASIGEWRGRKLKNQHGPDDMEIEYRGRKYFAGSLARYESEFGGTIMGDTKAHDEAKLRVLIAIARYDVSDCSIVVGQPTIKSKHKASSNDFVCLNSIGNPLCKDSVSPNFKARAMVRGFDVSFHSLRHSHATILIQYYRKSINAVSKRLGHADITTTLSVYASVLPQEDGDIADTMGNIMDEIKI